MGLEELRKKIDGLDSQILRLLNRRAEAILEIGKLKAGQRADYYSPSREEEVYRRLTRENRGPFHQEALRTVYREIISGSRSLQKRLKIAYLGPEATFTHMAAQEKFGSSCDYIPAKSIPDVFAEVAKDRADYGVVPVESSTEGVISYTLDMFTDSELKVSSEIFLEISQNLLANCKLEEVKRVYSHPQAIAQSRLWVESHLPQAEIIEVFSTAQAAQLASKKKNSAAIASRLAAQLYALEIISERIEDNPQNFTRFLVIGKSLSEPSSKDKTSIMFAIKDRVGALYDILGPFARHNINLTKIESRPTKKKPWEYIFFVDLEGHVADNRVRQAMDEVEKECLSFKVLGSYPAGR